MAVARSATSAAPWTISTATRAGWYSVEATTPRRLRQPLQRRRGRHRPRQLRRERQAGRSGS